jgi:hypothetical protein
LTEPKGWHGVVSEGVKDRSSNAFQEQDYASLSLLLNLFWIIPPSIPSRAELDFREMAEMDGLYCSYWHQKRPNHRVVCR